MRNAFIEELVNAAEKDKNIVLVVGDLGFGVIEPFVERFPDRFFNAGVAEQNMIGLCAGLASEGCHVFAYSIGNFPTFRCAEQIRNDIDYHQLPVTIVTVGGGLAYGNLGYSHHAIQDYALMRVMPNVLIAAPGDPLETRACVRYLLDNPQPSYLRLGKAGEASMHKDVPSIIPGEWLKNMRLSGIKLKQNKNAILTTGAILQVLQDISFNDQLPYDVYSLPLWGMQHKKAQLENLKNYELIITMEDHFEDGGFGSWLLESANANNVSVKIIIKAFDKSVCGLVAKQEGIFKKIGFDSTGILNLLNEVINVRK